VSLNTGVDIFDPLPQRYVTSEPGIGGKIKLRPEDFLVDELPLYEPSGEGEHLYIGVQKAGVSHGELMATLRRHFGVTDTQIGFAGMKDKMGITRQVISIHLPGAAAQPRDADAQPPHDRIRELWAARHRNKIQRGHLQGNRFSIRIREVDPTRALQARRTLLRLVQTGVPNYFGSQRFGYRRNNHLVGILLLRRDWRGIIDEVLGAQGTPFPEYQRERRELFDARHVEQAASHWTAADRSERIIINALRRGEKNRNAVLSVGRAAFAFWLSAFQSAAFNRVLDRRIDDGLFDQLIEGDLAWKHINRSMFPVTAQELATGALPPRLAALEISPSGPLWGREMRMAEGAPGRTEQDALAGMGMTVENFLASTNCPEGGRRAMRVPLLHPEIDAGTDEHGGYIRVAFDLPRGAYATVVLREIMKSNEQSADESIDE
jgi:tRNA pseudouridine13 synthase